MYDIWMKWISNTLATFPFFKVCRLKISEGFYTAADAELPNDRGSEAEGPNKGNAVYKYSRLGLFFSLRNKWDLLFVIKLLLLPR